MLTKIPSHGSLIKVDDIGVLLTGKSGIGKSECALELVASGAKLVCDDAPIFEYHNGQLIGRCPEKYMGYLHLRQLGMINLADYFTDQKTFAAQTPLDFIIQLNWVSSPTNQEIPMVVEKPDYKIIKIEKIKIYQLDLFINSSTNIFRLVNMAIKQFILSKA